MTRRNRKNKPQKVTLRAANDSAVLLDATPERLAHAVAESGTPANAWDYVNVAEIDSHQPIGLVRRFRATHLDRFYARDNPKRSVLTFRQWYAGDWYRTTHARAGFTLSVIAAYGERISTGEPNYGLARTEAQAQARDLWRQARAQFPRDMIGFMDRLLIHDELPRYSGHQRMRKVRDIAGALDYLADWLKLAPASAR